MNLTIHRCMNLYVWPNFPNSKADLGTHKQKILISVYNCCSIWPAVIIFLASTWTTQYPTIIIYSPSQCSNWSILNNFEKCLCMSSHSHEVLFHLIKQRNEMNVTIILPTSLTMAIVGGIIKAKHMTFLSLMFSTKHAH